MAGALSQDLRSRVIAAVDGGLSRNAAAKRFGVAIATAVRWIKDWREFGRSTPRPVGGDRRSHRIEAFADLIMATVDAQKDVTLAELAELLHRKHGVVFAESTIWRFLDRRSVTYKKNSTRHRATTARRARTAR